MADTRLQRMHLTRGRHGDGYYHSPGLFIKVERGERISKVVVQVLFGVRAERSITSLFLCLCLTSLCIHFSSRYLFF